MAIEVTENILQEADRLTSGEKRKEYGDSTRFYRRCAELWSTLLGYTVEPEQVGQCMIAFKLLREATAHKRDNLVDLAGYARTLELYHEDNPFEDNK